ncbi:hypothetical protein H6L08_11690, partial [Staphylococcus epidermidis]|nr:hypothetical protein [Staphylococcus epidermidis]
MNLSDEDKLYISRMTDQIKRSNTHEIKVNIETDDNLSEFIKQKIDDNIESVHKWATYFKSALMLTLFAVLLISVVATFMGGLF